MSGTSEGGKNAAITNKKRYGPGFYVKIGQIGGKVRHPQTRMFSHDRDLAARAGALGGTRSRRKKA